MSSVNFADAAATISQYRKLLDGAAGQAGTDKLIGTNDLQAMANDPGCPPELKAACEFFLQNPAQLNALETADLGGNADTATGFGDLDTFTKNFPVQQFGSQAQQPAAAP